MSHVDTWKKSIPISGTRVCKGPVLYLKTEIGRMDVMEGQRYRKVKYANKREVEVMGYVTWTKKGGK